MKVLVLGSHKGLGASVVSELLRKTEVAQVLAVSRYDSGKYAKYADRSRYQFFSHDLTKPSEQEAVLKLLETHRPQWVIYCAGGGPFGAFGQKKWQAHQWAFELNFLFPARLCQSVAQNENMQKFLFVGSQIAEAPQGDPKGASYAAAKWGMKGLLASLQVDYPNSFYLFSPGYMDTDMVPANAALRQQEGVLRPPETVAKELVQWVFMPSKNGFHKTM